MEGTTPDGPVVFSGSLYLIVSSILTLAYLSIIFLSLPIFTKFFRRIIIDITQTRIINLSLS